MDLMSAREAADKWGISQRRVAVLCSEGRIEQAQMVGNSWVIPITAMKPVDARSARYTKNDGKNETKKFVVTIEETVSQEFEICAKNDEEAMQIAEEKYKSGELVLSPGNLVCKQMTVRDTETNLECGWVEF